MTQQEQESEPPTTESVISQPSATELKVLPHRQYQTTDSLSPQSVLPSPLDQFRLWFKQAVESNKVTEPEAISLSTSTSSGIPSARMVLFKQLDSRGFIFFTNYTSRKSREIEENPWAAMVFYWKEIHRSVRVLGRVEKVSEEQSYEYFKSRPVGSQLGAWASKQSSIVGEGEVVNRLDKLEERFGAEVPLPDFWGGWRVVPTEVEFWSGKPSRLHDRVRYLRVEGSPDDNPQWTIDRLAP
ncbi:pyridoxamine 5'-phosphate oxidase [Pluteus cervinus]|uniref:Pyridoxamine 5'-phosphate oxidase n=1 Tax=Pluteus cervinus TaxID=181527 RepID=A0ACD3ASE8_9AGAR|nr:pyridoxamine 5'-phosphate oxidase [Pluteus cervinus]